MHIDGWIDEVEDGRVWGRLMVDGEVMGFDIALLDVLEDQRVDLEPGSYVSFPNGYLLVHKTMWTTHDLEQADKEADRLFKAFGWADRDAGQSAREEGR